MPTKYARLIKRGDVVTATYPGQEPFDEVVRDVDVVIHLASGGDLVVNANSEVDVVLDNLPADLLAQVEAMQSET